MAPRANWKGFLRLSLTCPVALFPATSDTEKAGRGDGSAMAGAKVTKRPTRQRKTR